MENKLTNIFESIPVLIKNTSLNINLDGWPAAVAVMAICGSGVTICALNVVYSREL